MFELLKAIADHDLISTEGIYPVMPSSAYDPKFTPYKLKQFRRYSLILSLVAGGLIEGDGFEVDGYQHYKNLRLSRKGKKHLKGITPEKAHAADPVNKDYAVKLDPVVQQPAPLKRKEPTLSEPLLQLEPLFQAPRTIKMSAKRPPNTKIVKQPKAPRVPKVIKPARVSRKRKAITYQLNRFVHDIRRIVIVVAVLCISFLSLSQIV